MMASITATVERRELGPKLQAIKRLLSVVCSPDLDSLNILDVFLNTNKHRKHLGLFLNSTS